jgi:two-component system cell cycle sensor histidine kinase/response regulator CckA
MQDDGAASSRDPISVTAQRIRGIEEYISKGLDLMCTVDVHGILVGVNPAFEKAVGLPKSEIVGRRFGEFLHPDDIESTREVERRLAAGEGVNHFPIRLCPHDGSSRWIGWSAYRTGGTTYAVGRDITEYKRAEENLRLLNRQLQMITACNEALIRATDECELLGTVCSIVVTVGGYRMAWVGFAEDDEAKTVRAVAHAGAEDGYLRNEWRWADCPTGRGPVGKALRTGQPCFSQDMASDPDSAPWREEALARGFAAVCALPLIAGNVAFGVLVVYSPSTDAFHQEEVALLAELAGDLGFGIQVLRTRVERSRAEENLRASEERFERMLQHSNDIIAVTDEHVVHSAVFGPVERILGYTPEELVGQSGFARVHPEDLGLTQRLLAEGLSAPAGTARAEYRIQHRNGAWIPLETVGANLLDDPSVRGVVLNIRDVSERKAAEAERAHLQDQLQQAMKMEAVGRLAGGVAHDFNNLLTAIAGNLELARLELAPLDPVMPYLEASGKAAESAAALTRQLLAFSRRQIIEPRVLCLNDLVTNLRRMAAPLIGESIAVETKLAPDLGAVKVDPGQFDQVLLNLVVNARDAMPIGGTLLIETANVELDWHYCAGHPYLTPGLFVLLAVSDTGCGMSDEVKRRLFEPFFTTKPTGKGTGLGLATIFGAVKQAAGTIEVYSEVGHGTSFKIYLPRVAGTAEQLEREVLPASVPHGHETILLVEDEASVRDVALAVLTRLGYCVRAAANGDEALRDARAHAGQIALLMTDVVMPGMNGRELAERLVALHPGVKVLFTSGYTEDVIVHHGVVDENLAFIGKPYTVAALAAKVRETLDGKAPGEFPDPR